MRVEMNFAAIAALSAVASLTALGIVGAKAQQPAPLAEGQSVFTQQSCDGCHGANGEGGVGPNLAGNTTLGDATVVITQILNGGGEMPPFETLTDVEVAAVANFIRGSWGNAFTPPVTDADVAAIRGAAAPAPAAPAAPAP